MRLLESTKERWPRHTMRYAPRRFACQLLILIAAELAVLIVLVAL